MMLQIRLNKMKILSVRIHVRTNCLFVVFIFITLPFLSLESFLKTTNIIFIFSLSDTKLKFGIRQNNNFSDKICNIRRQQKIENDN